MTWQDERSEDDDIYAQKVDSSGVPQWTADGVALCTADGNQCHPQITTDGSGGAIVTWQDERSGPGDDDIYAQRVSDDSPGPSPGPQPPPFEVVSTFYFAEGYTGAGFQEYLCLGNPEGETAKTMVTYLYGDGSNAQQQLEIPPNSRATLNVNSSAVEGREVSVKLESNRRIVAERPMYFAYKGAWSGGHDSVGATSPSRTLYFAEGYTGPGFEEWICVLNPGDEPADLTFCFQTQEEGKKETGGISVAPHSRSSFRANDLLAGGSYQTSLKLTSSQPVVAERPTYFDYAGTGNRQWTGGHCVMGTPYLAGEYYFAEGTTRGGFEEWLTLQNPNLQEITISATYQLGQGQGDPIYRTYTVPAESRRTVYVPGPEAVDSVGKDVSVHLSSTSDFLAERPTYFSYAYTEGPWTGGHCVIGSTAPAPEWFFAEGYTGPGFNQWLCLQNPGDSTAAVEITYYTQEAGALAARTETIPAHSRKTFMVNEHAGAGLQISTRVRVTSGPDIVAERPMYFDYSGRDGGHDVVGQKGS